MDTRPYIIKDTREKEGKGWKFISSKYFAGMKQQALKTGDYTIEGCEDIVTIERKASVMEFANNILEERFERELQRMKDIPYRYIVLEFTMDDIMGYPFNQKLPKAVKRKIKIRGNYILRKMLEYQQEYGVYIILAGDHGKEVCMSILKRVLGSNNGNTH